MHNYWGKVDNAQGKKSLRTVFYSLARMNSWDTMFTDGSGLNKFNHKTVPSLLP